MKYLLFITREPASDKKSFGVSLLARVASLAPCAVHLTDVNPPWPVDPLMGTLSLASRYDAMIEWRGDDAQQLLTVCAGLRCAEAHLYRVSETVDKPSPEPNSPGANRIAQLSLWRAHEGLQEAAVVRLWDAHMPLALRIQGGADRYVRYMVEERLSADAPPLFGVSSVGFASEADLVEHQFDSPEAAYALLEDSSHFIADEMLLYASAHSIAGGLA